MSGDSRLSARFGADTSDFKNGISQINRELKLIDSEFKATASTMGDWANNIDGLDARMKALTREIELQQEKVEALRYKHEQLAKAHGETSVEAQNAQIEFNREAEKLGKLQTELGQTETSLKALKNESVKSNNVFKDFGSKVQKLGQQVPALGTALSLLSNPLTLATAGLAAFMAIAKKSIGEMVSYNQQIREMKTYTGLSAEETSRLVQVADDMKIELGEARNAFEMMNKKGISPSIEKLAQIADEFVAAKDKAAFAEEANKKYGKSFANLIPMLAEGGDALREHAASIDENMLATEESIALGRKWEVQLDNFQDTLQGLEYELGEGLLPLVIELFQAINEGVVAQKRDINIRRVSAELMEKGIITEKERLSLLWDVLVGNKDQADAVDELNKLYYDNIGYEEKLNEARGASKIALDEENGALNILLIRTEEATIATRSHETATRDQEAAIGKAREASIKFAQEGIDKLHEATDSLVNEAINAYTKSLADSMIMQASYKLAMGEITQAEYDQILAMAPQIKNLEGMNQLLADGKIDWSYYYQAIKDGKVTQEELISALIATGMNAEEARKKVLGLADEINNMPDHKQIDFDIVYNPGKMPPPPGGAPITEQHGGIKNVIRPTLFMAGEDNRPETVITIPHEEFGNSLAIIQRLIGQALKGMNVQNNTNNFIGGSGGGGGSTHNSWSYVIQAANPLQTSDDLARQVRLLELMH